MVIASGYLLEHQMNQIRHGDPLPQAQHHQHEHQDRDVDQFQMKISATEQQWLLDHTEHLGNAGMLHQQVVTVMLNNHEMIEVAPMRPATPINILIAQVSIELPSLSASTTKKITTATHATKATSTLLPVTIERARHSAWLNEPRPAACAQAGEAGSQGDDGGKKIFHCLL
jgi:hypothetical protein